MRPLPPPPAKWAAKTYCRRMYSFSSMSPSGAEKQKESVRNEIGFPPPSPPPAITVCTVYANAAKVAN